MKIPGCVCLLSAIVAAAPPQPVPFAPGAVRGSAPSFTPDGKTVYTHLWDEKKGHTILVSDFRDGRWTLSRVAEFSGVYDDLEPCVSPDGARLLFSSSRPVDGRPGLRIWMTRRTKDGWSAPEVLGPPVNLQDRSGSGAAALARDGTLLFGSTRRNRSWPWEIFAAAATRDGYSEPEPLGEGVNSKGFIWSHTISPDGGTLVFASERAGGFGGIDLYIRRKEGGGPWMLARNLGSIINTARNEVWPRFSLDGKHLFFCREGEEPHFIYQVDSSALE